jgi:hypothetical protein
MRIDSVTTPLAGKFFLESIQESPGRLPIPQGFHGLVFYILDLRFVSFFRNMMTIR